MKDGFAEWPELSPPADQQADHDASRQRKRLRTVIDRLQEAREGTVPAGDDRHAAEADMLVLLVALEDAAAEALRRAIDDRAGDA